MEFSRYLDDRLKNLGKEEALNVTETSRDGNGIRKVRFQPQTARSLIEIPNHKRIVFNLTRTFEGLDNFLRLKGYDKKRIEKIHQDLKRLRGEQKISSPKRLRKIENREEVSNLLTQSPAGYPRLFTPYPGFTMTLNAPPRGGYGSSFMFPGNTLTPDEYLISPNGQYKCYYQNDGNLVISGPGVLKGILPCGKYNPNKYTDGGGAPPGTLVYDDSGQLIIYTNFESGRGTAVWATGIQGGANPYLIMRNDGILGSYSNGKEIWSTKGPC